MASGLFEVVLISDDICQVVVCPGCSNLVSCLCVTFQSLVEQHMGIWIIPLIKSNRGASL